ncbi:MAG: histidine--tRNA ligase [Deltaproteobacteria bacterium]|nr:histidine--tRNA ligase [Deltaproteobacteria bacterium]
MAVSAVRGMHDLYGDELRQWIAVEVRIKNVLGQFGYNEIRTPVLEKVEVFSHTVGQDTDIVEKQMYTVSDVGDECLVLRPEGTASFVRAVVEHQLLQSSDPGRYFYYLPMFRHERPQKGRLRQFHQFGIELIQDSSPEGDAEIVGLVDHLFREARFDAYEVKINSIGCENCRPSYREKLKSFFKSTLGSLCEQCQKRFERSVLRILDCKNESCKKIVESAPLITGHLCNDCQTHHQNFKKRLGQIGVSFVEDPHIVRGLDYYCRTAFEFVSGVLGAQSAVAAGGRYDGIASRFGAKPFPAVGVAIGMERLMMGLEQKGVLKTLKSGPVYYFAALGDKAFESLYGLADKLKKEGVWVEMNYEKNKSLKSQLKQADRCGARFVLIVGDDEIASGQGLLKEMQSGNQISLHLADLQQDLMRRAIVVP